jgi:hypothetical protein
MLALGFALGHYSQADPMTLAGVGFAAGIFILLAYATVKWLFVSRHRELGQLRRQWVDNPPATVVEDPEAAEREIRSVLRLARRSWWKRLAG